MKSYSSEHIRWHLISNYGRFESASENKIVMDLEYHSKTHPKVHKIKELIFFVSKTLVGRNSVLLARIMQMTLYDRKTLSASSTARNKARPATEKPTWLRR